jgi:hypothetical protein
VDAEGVGCCPPVTVVPSAPITEAAALIGVRTGLYRCLAGLCAVCCVLWLVCMVASLDQG